MSKSKGRKLVYVPDYIVDQAKKVSKGRGESLNLFISEVLSLALKAKSLGYTPQQAAEFLEIMQAQRNLGGAFVPADVLTYLNNKACEAEVKQLEKKWYESGSWHGKYLNEKFEDPVQAFKKFLEATRWDLSEVEVRQNEQTIKFRCISTLLTGKATELLAKFIEGAMHSIGYQTAKSDTLKGMILLDFKR
jgi:hypothetical protein